MWQWYLAYLSFGVIYTFLFVGLIRVRGNLKVITVGDFVHLLGVAVIWPICLTALVWVNIKDAVLFGGEND